MLLPNSTTALNAVAASLRLGEGDEVLITDREYGAMRLLWEEIVRRTEHVIVVAVPLPVADAEQLLEAVWGAVTPRTRVLFFSHVTSEAALVLPAQELCRRAREAGIIRVVDGAHTPGQLPLALDDLAADCYAGRNGHKWLARPKGSASCTRDALRAELRPPVVSWGWNDGYEERFAWSGTDDPTAVLSLGAAIEYQRQNDWPAVQSAVASSRAERRARSSSGWAGERIAATTCRRRRWSPSRCCARRTPARAPGAHRTRSRHRGDDAPGAPRRNDAPPRRGLSACIRLSVAATPPKRTARID